MHSIVDIIYTFLQFASLDSAVQACFNKMSYNFSGMNVTENWPQGQTAVHRDIAKNPGATGLS